MDSALAGKSACRFAGRPGMTFENASARACRRAVDRSGGLAEQDGALFRGANAAQIRIYLLRLGVGTFDRRAGTDRFEPALELREIFQLLALALVRHDPRVNRHVGDRIVAGDEG